MDKSPVDWSMLQNLLQQEQTQKSQEQSQSQMPINLESINKDNIFQIFEQMEPILLMRSKSGLSKCYKIGEQMQQISTYNEFFACHNGDFTIGNQNILLFFKGENLLQTLEGSSFQLVEFMSNYLVVIDKIDKEYSLLLIYDTQFLYEVTRITLYKFSKQQWPIIAFNNRLMALQQNKEIKIYNLQNFTPIATFQSLTNFSLTQDFLTLIQTSKSFEFQESLCEIVMYDLRTQKMISNFSLEEAHEAKKIWSKDESVLLIWSQKQSDASNQSYYGVHKLHHVQKQKEIKGFEGPIHDLAWNNDSTYFLVISGYMPAGTVLYNKDGVQLYLISQHHVNSIYWGNENVVALCGFGNLPGDIEIWDLQDIDNMKQIGKSKKDKVISFEWSKDGNYFLTGTTYPRLRVNNQYNIFTKEGKLMYTLEMEELYQICWYGKNIVFANNVNQEDQKKHKKMLSFNKGVGK